ncbi:unnamed protein product [Cylindrotheca closterium]|uniref:Major facilitator superfamily (MFS) profile domain-containing protein n=1 Tax=Cylindrotheca closterium TaxID=2856 RepID=A0AAD2FKA5_9STRA|nr:unnamed protein product [Cylindrotheca closterium]
MSSSPSKQQDQVNLRSADGLMQGGELPQYDFKTKMAGIAGNVLEWYDFSVYGYFSDIIGKVFFAPDATGKAALVESFAVFGIAFLIRPIGGAIFGYMGDNVGRKSALENSILLMALPTFIMGCLPSYASIGWYSTALLIICRMLQGFSVGGQLMSSVVFALEASPESTWGFQAGAVFAATTLGAVIGSLFAYALRENLTEEQMESFGWRIPFFFGVVGIIPGLYLKHRSKEIPVPKPAPQISPDAVTTPSVGGHPQLERQGTFQETFAPNNRRALIASMLVPAFTSGTYYIVFVWMAVYMQTIVEVPHAFGINSAVGVIGIGLCFAGGWMVDRLGAKSRVPLMLGSSLAFGLVAPYFISTMGQGDPLTCFILQGTMAVLMGIFGGAMHPWLISNFPPHIRLTSTTLAYNMAVSLVGGFSPFVATLLQEEYGNAAPGYIVSVLAVLAWLGLIIGSTAKTSWKDDRANAPKLSSVV